MQFNWFSLLAVPFGNWIIRLWKENLLFLAIVRSSLLQVLYRIAVLKTFTMLLVKHSWCRPKSSTSTLMGLYHDCFARSVVNCFRVANCQGSSSPMALIIATRTVLGSNVEKHWSFNQPTKKCIAHKV